VRDSGIRFTAVCRVQSSQSKGYGVTQRLYYNDSYIVDFTATVLERTQSGGQPAVVLNRTYFYPTSGGQPNDLGSLNGIAVIDVQARDGDGAVLHVLEQEIHADNVSGHVNWTRRFDHMQHHTGQHILSQAFVQIADAHTVGFHLSPDSVTIDLDKSSLADSMVNDVEDLANQIVFENRPVTARLVSPDEAQGVRMRKMPDHLLTDGLRVIEVQDFDSTACGGTHVTHTGEIGCIKILRLEKRGDKLRVEFRCGGRALRDYREKNSIVNAGAARLSSGIPDLEQAVVRLQNDYKAAVQTLKIATNQLVDYEAERLLRDAKSMNGTRLVSLAFDQRDPGELRLLASKLTQADDTTALLGTSGDKANLVFARGTQLTADMNVLLKAALATLGNGRGGGQPNMAQGGGVPATLAQVQTALETAEQLLKQGTT
jgi:alanyl-tRNA synthetase